MATNNSINNTITQNNFTVPAGSITASGNISSTAGNVVITAGNLTLPDTNTGGTQGVISFNTNTVIHDYPTGSTNFFAGFLAGTTAGTAVGTGNNGIGGGTLSLYTSGSQNTAMGHVALQSIGTGSNNSGFGGGAGNAISTGGNNTMIGYQSGQFIGTGSSNIALGYQAGNSWASANTNNINIGNVGANESTTIRIGTNATHTNAYIAGIDGVNVGSVAKVLTMASDHIGTATITGSSSITVTPGANTITLTQTTTPVIANYTTINSTPYVVTSTDYYMSVDTSTIAITIQLPNAPTQYRTFIIKDSAGNAFVRNVTVTTVGGVVIIEGATSYTMNTNYASINLLYDGVGYQLY